MDTFGVGQLIDQEKIDNQCLSDDPKERIKAIKQLKDNFSLLPNKQQAWNNFIKLTSHENSVVRSRAAYALKSVFSDVPDKQQAWNNLVKLATDEDNSVRSITTSALKSTFSYVPNKQQAWNDLVKLATDENSDMRSITTSALISVLHSLPYNHRQQAWNDLVKLATDENSDMRSRAASTLGYACFQVSDKQHVWDDLIRLTSYEDSLVRFFAADALDSVFSLVPDKQQAWEDLHRLTTDQESSVRYGAAYALGSAFTYLADKQQIWNDLHKLTIDEDIYVRYQANHSLGKLSIFRASQSEKEENYKNELEKAIEFFEKSAQEFPYLTNPAQFCLPFYRSFHTILFKKQDAKEEVNKYLAKAKDAINGSKSRETLFEAVENLAEALKEVQSLENLDLDAKKSELNFYRQYCDRAAELMKDTEETAPFATITLRKGLPILDRNLKELLKEIQKKAKIACKEAKGTDKEEIACVINREVQKWEISNTEEMVQNIEDLAYILKNKVADIPENGYILNKIELMRHERDLNKQYGILLFVIPQIQIMKVIPEKELDNKLLKLDLIHDKTVSIETKLDLIQKTLDKGLEKLDMLSTEVGGREGELIQTFSKNILKITEKRDNETLKSFLEEVLKKESILIKEIEKTSVTPEEKEETKKSILNIRSVIDKVKHPIKSFGKDVTKEIVVTFAAEEIVKLVFQLVLTGTSMATVGVPIPPQILNLLTSVMKI